MQSSLYEGTIRHRRTHPVKNSFSYRLFLLYLDLQELPHLFDRNWFWSWEKANLACFRRSDYLGSATQDLAEAVKDRVEEETEERPRGPVRLLTHLRYFGYAFNPVSFYYCFDEKERLHSIVSEITNTPWKERFSYVLSAPFERDDGKSRKHLLEKRFHVSPFMEMDLNYAWRFSLPGERIFIHMDNLKGSHKFFDATMTLKRGPISRRQLARVLLQYPFMTLKVSAAIHWQAFKLWLKSCPVHAHPKSSEANGEGDVSASPWHLCPHAQPGKKENQK